ncbi:MAG: NAD(P)-dependent oxidoreductase [Gaiellaceae bacterium]
MSALAQETLVGDFSDLKPPLSEEEALVEADRCLRCGGVYATAPCSVACPADVDVPTFVAQIADGDTGAAAKTIFAQNILGASCARVCPVEVLCQDSCVMNSQDETPVAIGRLQRFATDWAFANGVPMREKAAPNGHKVAVIGAGPAGLACAGELVARGYDVTVYDERAEVGGLIRYAIAPFRQHTEPLPDEAKGLADLGVRIKLGVKVDSAEALAKIEQDAEAIFLGIGYGEDVDVKTPGDDLDGVWESLPFIEALKDGNLPQVGRRAAVIGGGNTAMDVAREALRLGAEEVTVLYRRTQAEMPAFYHEYEEALEEGIVFKWLTLPVAFKGENGRLSAVECQPMKLGEPDDSGRRRPEPIEGADFDLPVDTIIKAIGQRPREEFLSLIDGLELEWGRIKIDPTTGQTTNPKYFAAGDAINGGATAVQAVGGAKVAVAGIEAFLQGEKR